MPISYQIDTLKIYPRQQFQTVDAAYISTIFSQIQVDSQRLHAINHQIVHSEVHYSDLASSGRAWRIRSTRVRARENHVAAINPITNATIAAMIPTKRPS